MTANEPERLDKALVRPGRIDKQIYLSQTSQSCAVFMFERMFAFDCGDAEANEHVKTLTHEFGRHVPADTFTPAQLQEYMLSYRGDSAGAIQNFGPWLEQQTEKYCQPGWVNLNLWG